MLGLLAAWRFLSRFLPLPEPLPEPQHALGAAYHSSCVALMLRGMRERARQPDAHLAAGLLGA